MRKNIKAAPADITTVASNISFNSSDKKFFKKVLYIIAGLFIIALLDIFNINFYSLLDAIAKNF